MKFKVIIIIIIITIIIIIIIIEPFKEYILGDYLIEKKSKTNITSIKKNVKGIKKLYKILL